MVVRLAISPVALTIFIWTIGLSLYVLFGDRRLYDKLILHPGSLSKKKNYYTLLTSGFIHANIPHLAFNMITFYFFAFNLELMIGHVNFILLYFSSLIISDIPTVIKNRNNHDYRCLGASGAVSAIIFSFIIFNPFSRIYVMFIPIGIPAVIFAIFFIGFSMYGANREHSYINHSAHLWGALYGIAFTVLIRFIRKFVLFI